MIKKVILLTTLSMLTSTFLFAQTDATGETNLYAELKKADNQLNITYKKTINKLSIENRKTLLSEQRNWIKERDSKCTNDKAGGVIENKLRIDCLIQETLKRTSELMNWKKKK